MSAIDYWWMKLQAMAWLVLGRTAPAKRVFDQMVERWPDNPYPVASRAHLHAQAGHVVQALADSTRVVALTPNEARAWFNHGYLLEAAERWEEAIAAFGRATELSPKLDRAWYGMGMVLIRLQRYDEALTAMRRTTELQPMSPYGWYQLARVHVDRKQPEEAVKIIHHLRGFEPKVAAQLERETGLLTGSTGS